MGGMTFTASMEQLHPMLQFIRVEVKAAGFKGVLETQIELALEEAIVNIIQHGYQDSNGFIEILSTPLPSVGIKFILVDSGIPYDPLLKVKNRAMTTQQPKINDLDMIGGFGVNLIVTIMNQIDYEYKEGHNILALTKFLENKH